MDDMTRILVVEDDRAYSELVRRFLADSVPAENVVFTDSMASALATSGKFGVILADLVLPDANDLEVVHALHKKWPHTPIVAMSGMLDESRSRAVMEAGAQDFLLKDEVTNAKKHLARILSRAMDRSEVLARTMAEGISSIHATLQRLEAI